MLVYKFRACNQRTWELLLNRVLFFATPDDLNDPLDSSIDINGEYERAKEVIRAKDTSDDGRLSFLLHMLNQRKFVRKETEEAIHLNEGVHRFVRSRGILSLSMTPHDALLWSHYANGHRGLCLEFDSEFLKPEGVFISDKVVYRDKPPYVALFVELVDELGKLVRPWEEGHHHSDEEADQFYSRQLGLLMRANLLVKSTKWRYEEEFRIISANTGFHPFPAAALRRVILGCETSAADIHTLGNILSHPDYSHVGVARVQNVPGTFEFSVIDEA